MLYTLSWFMFMCFWLGRVLWISDISQVCVKVQHHGVGSLMKTDLVTIEFIAAKMMKLHKGAPDFTVTLSNSTLYHMVSINVRWLWYPSKCKMGILQGFFKSPSLKMKPSLDWAASLADMGICVRPISSRCLFFDILWLLPCHAMSHPLSPSKIPFHIFHRDSGPDSRMASRSRGGSGLPAGSKECHASGQCLETALGGRDLSWAYAEFVFAAGANHGLYRGLEDHWPGSDAIWGRSGGTGAEFGSCLCSASLSRGPHSWRSTSRSGSGSEAFMAVEEVKVKWQPPSLCVDRVVFCFKSSIFCIVQEMCLSSKYPVVMQSRCGLFCWIGDSLRHKREIAWIISTMKRRWWFNDDADDDNDDEEEEIIIRIRRGRRRRGRRGNTENNIFCGPFRVG